MDEVDAFHAQRDKILLDDDAASDDLDVMPDSETREVLRLDEDEDEEENDEEEEDEDEEEADEEEDGEDDDDDLDRYRTMILPASVTEEALHRKAPRDAAHEEQYSHEDDEDEEDMGLGWGANKHAYYSGNTDKDLLSDSDVDEEKAHELETNEAIRLQRLSRADMNDSEFGLDDIDAEEAQIQADEQSDAARARRRRELDGEVGEAKLTEEAPEAVLQALRTRAPIVLALVDEFPQLLEQQEEAKAYVNALTEKGERQLTEIAHLYYQALLSYTMLLAFFFQLACKTTLVSDLDSLLSHPILERLFQFKRALVEMKQLGLFDPHDDNDDNDDGAPSLMGPATEEDLEELEQLGDLEPNELEDLLADEKENRNVEAPAPAPPKKAKKTKTRKALPSPTPEAPLASIAEVQDDALPARRPSSSLSMPLEEADAYGEPTHMRDAERKDKVARQRAVQFHATGANPTPSSKQRQLDGDTDIPYRDRRQIREAVATAKANRAAKSRASVPTTLEPLEEWGENDWQTRDEVMEDDERDVAPHVDDDDVAYYDLVSTRKRQRKQADKAAYDQQRLDERVWDDETLAPGEHRTIDYTIAKNKGLTPHRPKTVRNPRVKRRMRYDRAKKRLSSTRAVYKGGQSALQGGYAGEKSGISTHLVKSRKLGS